MKELGQFAILVVWVGIISVVAWGIEQILERMGYRVSTVEERHAAEARVPPTPEE